MLVIRRRRGLAVRQVFLALLTGLATPASSRAAAQAVATAPTLPARITDEAFWKMVSDFSEPGGTFRSDNFVSNETTFQHVIPRLNTLAAPGGVYLGVGPDQNFTYVVALRPRIAFIIDIRRQNMLLHLLYKALMEMSDDRADFVSRLFSRPRPAGLDTSSTPDALFQAFAATAPDSLLFRKNLAAVKDRLLNHNRFALSSDDLRAIEYVYTAFHGAGPDITYSFSSFPGGQFGRRMPTYGELMRETDGFGEHRSYLATEANFRVLRELQRNNLIVPLVGDFSGDKAIRAVGQYLKEQSATVTAFYLSNVEQYLFRQGDAWQRFFTNVGTLPVSSSSTFIRAVFNNAWFPDPSPTPGPRSVTMLAPIGETVAAFSEGRIQTYYDVIQMSK